MKSNLSDMRLNKYLKDEKQQLTFQKHKQLQT